VKARFGIQRVALIWVIPYLILGILGGGAHNHPQVLGAAPGSSQAATGNPAACRVDLAGGTASGGDCPACQWLLNSTACGLTYDCLSAPASLVPLALPPSAAADASPRLAHQSRAPPSR
jgi:hypothetical protein